VRQAILNDFDLTAYRYDPADSPWRSSRNSG
jgi:hypothetical protein